LFKNNIIPINLEPQLAAYLLRISMVMQRELYIT